MIYRIGEFVIDINQTSLSFTGLSAGRVVAGQPVSVTFTVSHVRPPTGIEIFSAKDTFSGVVLDAQSGLVILLMDTAEVSLSLGRYVLVRLTSLGPLPDYYAGKSITVMVGPYTLFQAAAVGQPYAPTGVLSRTITVPNTPIPTTTGSTPNLGTYVGVGVGVLTLGGIVAGYIAVRRYRQRTVG
jgi:hypothetical protein